MNKTHYWGNARCVCVSVYLLMGWICQALQSCLAEAVTFPCPERWAENFLTWGGSKLYSQACVKTCWCLCKVVELLFFLSCLAPAQQCGGYSPARITGWVMTAMSPVCEAAWQSSMHIDTHAHTHVHRLDGKVVVSQTEGYKVCSCGFWHRDSGLCLFPQCLPF